MTSSGLLAELALFAFSMEATATAATATALVLFELFAVFLTLEATATLSMTVVDIPAAAMEAAASVAPTFAAPSTEAGWDVVLVALRFP